MAGQKLESKTEAKPRAAKPRQNNQPSPSKAKSKFEPKPTSSKQNNQPSASKAKSKFEPKTEAKPEPKTEAKPTSAFPGKPFDKNTMPKPSTQKASEDSTIASPALPVEDTSLRFETFGVTSKAPSAFEKTDRGYRSAGFRKKNKDISAGPALVGFHLGKRASSPSKIEGPSWLRKTTEKMANFFKSQNRNLEPTHASIPVCKLTKNIVKEVCTVQRGETSGLQKSVITNVPISHGFPGISFVTGQEAANDWSEQFPNAFPQQKADENMGNNTDLLDRPLSRREEQISTNEPVDEVEPDPWPKKCTADVGEVDEVQSPTKMSRVTPSPSSPVFFCVGELLKAFDGLKL